MASPRSEGGDAEMAQQIAPGTGASPGPESGSAPALDNDHDTKIADSTTNDDAAAAADAANNDADDAPRRARDSISPPPRRRYDSRSPPRPAESGSRYR